MPLLFQKKDESDVMRDELKEFEDRRFKWGWWFLLFTYVIQILQIISTILDSTTGFHLIVIVYLVLETIGIIMICRRKNKNILLACLVLI